MPKSWGPGFTQYEGHEVPENSKVYSPDRKKFAFFYVSRHRSDLYDDDTDYEVQLCDAATGTDMASFGSSYNVGHAGSTGSPVDSVRFSEDSRKLFVRFEDGSETPHWVPMHPGEHGTIWNFTECLRKWTTDEENARLDAVDTSWTAGSEADREIVLLLADRMLRVFAPMVLEEARTIPALDSPDALKRLEELGKRVEWKERPEASSALWQLREAADELSKGHLSGFIPARAAAVLADMVCGIPVYGEPDPKRMRPDRRGPVLDEIVRMLSDLAACARKLVKPPKLPTVLQLGAVSWTARQYRDALTKAARAMEKDGCTTSLLHEGPASTVIGEAVRSEGIPVLVVYLPGAKLIPRDSRSSFEVRPILKDGRIVNAEVNRPPDEARARRALEILRRAGP